MIQDKGPSYNLGFGVRRDLDKNQRTGQDPNSGVVAKALNAHPVMRFFATAALTMVGMHVAGKLVREGGLHLGFAMEQSGIQWQTSIIKDLGKVREVLDGLQGTTRLFAEGNDAETEFFEKDGHILRGTQAEVNKHGFFFTKEERQKAIDQGSDAVPAAWTWKDEVRQSLVSTARRMPYELPAAYAVQRGLINPLVGNDPNKHKVNWFNPVDVVSDFVTQSTRNLAFMIGPAELAGATTRQAYNRLMSAGDEAVSLTNREKQYQTAAISLKTLLSKVGADSVDVLDKAFKFSNQSTGAFATGVQEARKNSLSLVDWLNQTRHGIADRNAGQTFMQLSRGQKVNEAFELFRGDAPILNVLPGPFKGLGSGLTSARDAFTEIGLQHEAFQNYMRYGPDRFMQMFGKKDPNALRRVQQSLGSGSSGLSELAAWVQKEGNKGPGPSFQNMARFQQGTFFRQHLEEAYKQELKRKLVQQYGVSDEAATQFIKIAHPNAIPMASRNIGASTEPIDISNRLAFGKEKMYASSTSAWHDMLASRMRNFSAQDRNIIKANIGSALNDVDVQFRDPAWRRNFDQRIANSWTAMERTVIPKYGEQWLTHAKEPYDTFSSMTSEKLQFLQRKTAQVTGIALTDKSGKTISDAIVQEGLQRHGFDPTDPYQLRAYLVSKKAIGSPWATAGRNIFGMRALTIDEALGKGYFKTSKDQEDIVRSVANQMALNDPVSSVMGSFRMKGVYQSSTGQIFDATALRRRWWSFTDKLADQIQIPLIHTPILKLFGYDYWRDARQRALVQISPVTSTQPFLHGVDTKGMDPDFYMWTRSRGRGSKGIVQVFGRDESGGLIQHTLSGQYRAISSDGQGMAARMARIASGDIGATALDTGAERSTFKRFLGISDDQRGSVFGYIGRLIGRRLDLDNPVIFSKLLSEGKLESGGKVFVLDAKNQLVEQGNPSNIAKTSSEIAKAFDNLTAFARRNAVGKNVIDSLEKRGETEQSIRGMVGYDFATLGDQAPATFPGGYRLFSSLKTPTQATEAARLMMKGDERIGAGLNQDERAALKQAQRVLIYNPLDKAGSGTYFDTAVGGPPVGSVTTRFQELKANLYQYAGIRSGIINGVSTDTTAEDLVSHLLVLRSRGLISGAEFTETRAAILSMQVHGEAFGTYKRVASTLENQMNLLSSVRQSPVAKDLFGNIASGRVGLSSGGTKGSIQAFLRRNLSVSRSKWDGFSYNPFGNTDSVFVPTFGSSFGRNPLGATRSVLGLGGGPENFSGSSIPSYHLVDRLNRYFKGISLGLDPTDYKSPAEMYLRGIIGRRVAPAVIAGTAFMTLDRTLGGYTQPKDQYGQRVYSPLVLGTLATGAAHVQAMLAGIIPGGMTYQQKKQEIFSGDVPIREGRFWPLGNTPFMGGRVEYFRPSWYRRLKAGALYTDQTYGTPLERAAYGYDYSPLRPLDPYRFEKQHYYDRPYPMTGEYFSGPWGPLTSVLNATVGKILKPQRMMHEDALKEGLTQYARIGAAGAYNGASIIANVNTKEPLVSDGPITAPTGSSGPSTSSMLAAGAIAGQLEMRPGGYGTVSNSLQSAQNRGYAAAAYTPLNTARNTVGATIAATNSQYVAAAARPVTRAGVQVTGDYGVPTDSTMRPRIIAATAPGRTGTIGYQLGKLGYETQELSGIYGFAFGSLRERLGFGTQDFTTVQPRLATSAQAYGSGRSFWNLSLGGLGDFSSPLEGQAGNIEFSEIARRFIPHERAGTQFINPIPNEMGLMHPWLPGADYFTNFRQGDPYTSIPEGELRLPGEGYERLHQLHSDATGKYGLVDRHKILGDVAPWSDEFRRIDAEIENHYLTPSESKEVEQTRQEVAAKGKKYTFYPYKYKGLMASDFSMNEPEFLAHKGLEHIAHMNTIFNTKFLPHRTAVEDWERDDVYGATFPQWQHPIRDFLKPMMYQATQRNPFAAALALGAAGTLFGHGPEAKTMGAIIGGSIGFAAGAYGGVRKLITGQRYIPETRRKELAIEEYTDILGYTRAIAGARQARATGDDAAAAAYTTQAEHTMYGADLYNSNLQDLTDAVPKRKREHFQAMINAPQSERGQILSTAPRLERRIYEAAWGMPVEERPDLTDYFQQHELPSPSWEGWNPDTNMDHIKIKLGQSQGLDMSQMGYYPQEIREANLVNPSYPNFSQHTSKRNVEAELRMLLLRHGVNGDVRAIQTPYAGTRLQMNVGV